MAPLRSHGLAWLLALALGLTLSACVPTAVADRLAGPAAQEVERTAYVAYHRMELGRLQLGVYTTNVLVDVVLPRGARLTLEDFTDDGYRLRVDSDAVPGVAWYVSPSGVRRVIQR
ncbi:MAG: hypothetical protein K0A98_01810 [Trueperaceae bacterium]|nr:hypothetical protein [Trueperaceae bacterium]